jgi:hypothetical protein
VALQYQPAILQQRKRRRRLSNPVATPAKGKAKVKVTSSGKKVSYGQAGKAKDGGARVKPGTSKGDAYCARSAGQMKKHPKAAKDPNSPLRLSRKRWKCKGKKSTK